VSSDDNNWKNKFKNRVKKNCGGNKFN
jgi:hypothetical protein